MKKNVLLILALLILVLPDSTVLAQKKATPETPSTLPTSLFLINWPNNFKKSNQQEGSGNTINGTIYKIDETKQKRSFSDMKDKVIIL
jgi:hypothetical protein